MMIASFWFGCEKCETCIRTMSGASFRAAVSGVNTRPIGYGSSISVAPAAGVRSGRATSPAIRMRLTGFRRYLERRMGING